MGRLLSFCLTLTLTLSLASLFTSSVDAAILTPPVSTTAGLIQGYSFEGTDIWRGVPFASPPIGPNRFRPPQPLESWTGVKMTLVNNNICPQLPLTDWLFLGNEDCLYLDIYAPSNRTSSSPPHLLPVYVWFFGGGYVLGDGYEFGFYDGTNLAMESNSIVVTMNYRLGSLGLLALDELKAEDPNGLTGNYALFDQLAALKWVQNNIAAFGGDPNRVTIGGESAGAFSVCWHIASPLSSGLFSAAIMQSGTCNAKQFFVPYNDSQEWSRTFVKSIGCDPNDSKNLLNCIREIGVGELVYPGATTDPQTGEKVLLPPTADNSTNTPLHFRIIENTIENLDKLLSGELKYDQSILQHRQVDPRMRAAYLSAYDRIPIDYTGFIPALYPVLSWATTVDGIALTDNPLNIISAGKHNSVPIIMGTNKDEGSIFVSMMADVMPNLVHYPVRDYELPVIVNHFFPNLTQELMILNEYPTQNYSSPDDLVAAVLRDYFFACANRRALRAFHPYQPNSTYLYHFDYPGDFPEDPSLGDYHTFELQFTWGNPWPPLIHQFSKNDTEMSADFMGFWGNFIQTRNPNRPNPRSESWPAYDPDADEDVIMTVPLGEETRLYEQKCDFWDLIWETENQPNAQTPHFPREVLKRLRAAGRSGDQPAYLNKNAIPQTVIL